MAIVQCQANLLEVVGAGHAIGRVAHFLHGRDQQANQNRDDRNNYEQFDQRETTLITPGEEAAHANSFGRIDLKDGKQE